MGCGLRGWVGVWADEWVWAVVVLREGGGERAREGKGREGRRRSEDCLSVLVLGAEEAQGEEWPGFGAWSCGIV